MSIPSYFMFYFEQNSAIPRNIGHRNGIHGTKLTGKAAIFQKVKKCFSDLRLISIPFY